MDMIEVKKISPDEAQKQGIFNWPIWEKEPSAFSWTYDQDEYCYIIEGQFSVETDEQTFHCSQGDYILFHAGLSCRWIIHQHVKKHYHFPQS